METTTDRLAYYCNLMPAVTTMNMLWNMGGITKTVAGLQLEKD